MTVSKRAAPRPRRNGTPRRPASRHQGSAAHSPVQACALGSNHTEGQCLGPGGRSGRAQRLASTSCQKPARNNASLMSAASRCT